MLSHFMVLVLIYKRHNNSTLRQRYILQEIDCDPIGHMLQPSDLCSVSQCELVTVCVTLRSPWASCPALQPRNLSTASSPYTNIPANPKKEAAPRGPL